jgi:cytochrome c biogenesis factor
MKHGLMAFLAFCLFLFESAHAQQQWINSSHSFYSNEDGRYFALTLVAILAGVFVVFSVAAFITQLRRTRELPKKEQRRDKQTPEKEQPVAEEKERTCQKCGAKLTKAPTGDWFCLNC